MEAHEHVVPLSRHGESRRDDVEDAAPDDDRPARRRRSALLGGGVLIAASPVAVAAGLFVPGFAALGVGTALLLLPPRVRQERRHRSPVRVVRGPAAAVGRGVAALARSGAHAAARTFTAVERFVAIEGRGAVEWFSRVSVEGAAAVGRAASAGASRGWAGAPVVALGTSRGFRAATGSLAREARSASVRASEVSRPVLRRGWAACQGGSTRAAHELAGLVRSAQERSAALIEARSGPPQLGSLPPRARRPPGRSSAGPVRRPPGHLAGRAVRPPRHRQ